MHVYLYIYTYIYIFKLVIFRFPMLPRCRFSPSPQGSPWAISPSTTNIFPQGAVSDLAVSTGDFHGFSTRISENIHHGSISPNKLWWYGCYVLFSIYRTSFMHISIDLMCSFRYEVLSCMDIPINWRNCNQRSTLPDCVGWPAVGDWSEPWELWTIHSHHM